MEAHRRAEVDGKLRRKMPPSSASYNTTLPPTLVITIALESAWGAVPPAWLQTIGVHCCCGFCPTVILASPRNSRPTALVHPVELAWIVSPGSSKLPLPLRSYLS